MTYLGNTPTQQAFTPTTDYFSGNGSTTAFTLSRPVASVNQIEVVIENVVQNPSDAYTVSGNTLTFTSAPLSGTNNIYVRYTSPITQVIQPGQATVGTDQIQSGVTVSFADGSASTPSITNLDDSNTGIFFPTADTIAFTEGGVESMRIDSSGNVGIGTSSPSTIGANLVVQGTGTRTVSAWNSTSVAAGVGASFYISGGTAGNDLGAIGAYFAGAATTDGSYLTLSNRAVSGGITERMRITSAGNVGIGTTTADTNGGLDSTIKVNGTNAGIVFARSDVLKAYFYADNGTSSLYGQTEAGTAIRFVSATAGVSLANGATSWASLSDERNKENLTPILDALDKVNSLRSVTGKYKEDAEGTSRSFLIAQDVQAVLPEAIDIGTDEDATLSLRYTDIIPLLVASIKELNAKVEAQAARIAELEGAE
jgi:hypothetical protein